MMVRDARPEDVRQIEAVMAPEVAAGRVLPRAVRADEFLVAEDPQGRIVGVVALAAWSAAVVELGSLVSAAQGRGLGALLVAAAVQEAARRGYTSIVALTSISGFFARNGFLSVADRPWARARGCGTLPVADFPELGEAVANKARRCAACPRLAGCGQDLLVRRLPVAHPLQVQQVA
jgi:N-acetylglutamate synthase-like GNAT family acetyltransferase